MSRLPGSDILAHSSACDPKTGIVTPEARKEVMERTQAYFPQSSSTALTQPSYSTNSRESILAVISLHLDDVAHRLKNRRMSLDVDGGSKEWLALHGYSVIYGARAIARVVRTDVLFLLVRKLLRGTIGYVFLSLLFEK
jgi:ATP-dependent Clp protease ATP-binding subunit ClpB